MKIFDDAKNTAITNMGIDKNTAPKFSVNPLEPSDWDSPRKSDQPIDPGDIVVTPEGTMEYHGRRIIVYIRDQFNYTASNSEYKFHVVWCTTLETKKNNNTYGKYVRSENTDGKFIVSRNGNDEELITMNVCKNCLKLLNWKNYNAVPKADKDIIYVKFSIVEFFQTMDIFNGSLPIHTAETEYPSNWNKISRTMKERRNYTCENCNKHFQNGHGLHLHHKNGLRYDNRFTNLEVLCANCHQLRHSHRILGAVRHIENNIQGELF